MVLKIDMNMIVGGKLVLLYLLKHKVVKKANNYGLIGLHQMIMKVGMN